MSDRELALQFALSIVGGPYDGAPGLVFVPVEECRQLPTAIALDRCPGDRRCRMPARRCSPGHVAYWIPELEPVPSAAISYALQEDSIEVNGSRSEARYVLGGLPAWGRGETAELAGVGVGEVVFDEYAFGRVVDVKRDGRAVRVWLWEES